MRPGLENQCKWLGNGREENRMNIRSKDDWNSNFEVRGKETVERNLVMKDSQDSAVQVSMLVG